MLLLVDNAGGHNISKEKLSLLRNVKLEYLPPNTTHTLQPLDAGIINTFKTKYKTLLINSFIKQIDSDEPQLNLPNVYDALYLIVKAWKLVTSECIYNCWRHCKIVDFKLKQEQTDEINSLMLINNDDIEKLDSDLKRLNLSRFAFKSIPAEEFIAYGENEPICEDLTDLEIRDNTLIRTFFRKLRNTYYRSREFAKSYLNYWRPSSAD